MDSICQRGFSKLTWRRQGTQTAASLGMTLVSNSNVVLLPARSRRSNTLLSSAAKPRHSVRTSLLQLRAVSTNTAAAAEAAAGDASAQLREEPVVVEFPESTLFVPYPAANPDSAVYLSQHTTAEELRAALADYIVDASAEAVKQRGIFTIALSGGSLVEVLTALATEPWRSRVAWSAWHVLWVDERFVKHTTRDSNFKLAAETFLSKLPIPEDQILATDDSLATVEEAAEDYNELLRELVEDGVLTTTQGVSLPRLDLILLGMGPDGHVASLFPNSPLLAERTRWVLPLTTSPKPPPRRVTMSLPVINAARKVAFVAAGPSKAEVVQRVLETSALPGSLPAQLVRPYSGSTTWFIDAAAAKHLRQSDWNVPKMWPNVQM